MVVALLLPLFAHLYVRDLASLLLTLLGYSANLINPSYLSITLSIVLMG